MPATNIIGPIEQEDWQALRNARGAIEVFNRDKARYEAALEKYNNIYKDTLSPYIATSV